MKIGIDGRVFQGKATGVNNYVTAIIAYMLKELPQSTFIIYTNKNIYLNLNSDRLQIILDNSILRNFKSVLWTKFISPFYIKKDKIDMYLAGGSFLPAFFIDYKTCFIVHDLNYILVPETMSYTHYLSFKFFFKRDLVKSDYILTNSISTKKKINNYFKREVDFIIQPEINPLYKKLDPEYVLSKLKELNINYPFLLCVGTLEPRKNIDKAIAGFIELKKKGKLVNHKLLIVGEKGWKNKSIYEFITSDIVFLGYIDVLYMPVLYNSTDLFIFLSSYEGFGIPIREAVYCNAKILASDIEELREASSGHAKFIKSTSSEDVATAIMDCIIERPSIEQDILNPSVQQFQLLREKILLAI